MSDIVIVGASGHCGVVIDIVEKEGRYRIAGLLDNNKPLGTDWRGYRVIGVDAGLAELAARGIRSVLIAIGDNWVRARVAREIEALDAGIAFVKAVHPSAQIARGAAIGDGTVVMAGAVINTNSRVGRHCILNTRCSLDHDSTMGDFASLGPNATTGGGVEIGAYAAVAISATVLHGRRVGEHSVVGAGATVFGDVPPRVVAYGTPARVMRARAPGDRYL